MNLLMEQHGNYENQLYTDNMHVFSRAYAQETRHKFNRPETIKSEIVN